MTNNPNNCLMTSIKITCEGFKAQHNKFTPPPYFSSSFSLLTYFFILLYILCVILVMFMVHDLLYPLLIEKCNYSVIVVRSNFDYSAVVIVVVCIPDFCSTDVKYTCTRLSNNFPVKEVIYRHE